VVGGGAGLLGAPAAVLALVLALATAAAWAVAGRQRSVALGPSLVAGALVVVVGTRVAGVPGWGG
ncbi:MAG: hypothetical protein M3487_11470, partial [Actinomycetota bacterium]|nr:hypothetical protein [Actinomycetota bacterium]